MYEQLLAFKSESGHTMVPSTYKPNPKLGKWVYNQRYYFHKLAKGEQNQADIGLDMKRIEALDAIGFNFFPSTLSISKNMSFREASWEGRFSALKNFKHKHGHCNVTRKQDNSLARWVERQRCSFRSSEITPSRREKLDSIGFQWHTVFDEKKLADQNGKEASYRRKEFEIKEKSDRSRKQPTNFNILSRFLCEKCYTELFESEEECLAHEALCEGESKISNGDGADL